MSFMPELANAQLYSQRWHPRHHSSLTYTRFISFSRVFDTKNAQLSVVESDSAEHESVSAHGLNRVDTHAAHHFHHFTRPCGDQILKTLVTDVGIEPFNKIGPLCCNTPVAFTGLAGVAEVAAEREQRCGSDIDCIGAETDRLYHVCTASD